jgi:hypothetical protein
MRALSVVSSITASLRRFSVFLRIQQPYPNYRMNPDLRSPIFPQAFALLSVYPPRYGLAHRQVLFAAVHESGSGRFCCKSRKLNDAENLAKADF